MPAVLTSAKSSKLIRILGVFSLAGMLAQGVLVFGFTPQDAYMGFSQKIMYIHVPSMWVAYLAFFVVFFCSIGYLWKREMDFDKVARCAAEIGVLFCALGLLTGSIWGRPTWNTYWVWDARLTSTLVLLLIFIGYVLLRAFAGPGEQQARLASVVGIVGFLDIPLIHVSVQWWRTLHQDTSVFKVVEGNPKPSMPPELLVPLLAGVVLFTLIFAFLLLYRIHVENQVDSLERSLAQS